MVFNICLNDTSNIKSNMPSNDSVCKLAVAILDLSVALVICKKWHRKLVPCFQLLQKSDITLQFSFPGSKLTFHPYALICKLGAGILDLTVAIATSSTCRNYHCYSKLLDPNYIHYCSIQHSFTIQMSDLTFNLTLLLCK